MVTWVTALGARRSVRTATPVDDQASAFDAGAVAGAARVAEPQLLVQTSRSRKIFVNLVHRLSVLSALKWQR